MSTDSESSISRLVPHTVQTKIAAMMTMITTFPNLAKRADALAVMPGQGEYWRLVEAIRDYQSLDYDAQHLLIAGAYQEEKTWQPMTEERLRPAPYNLVNVKGVSIQPQARHTPEQADWIVNQAYELGIEKVAVYVSPYHLPRAYLTVLRSMIKRHQDPWLWLLPVAVAVSPSKPIPETGRTAWELVAGEMERIAVYQERGDVSHHSELQTYLSWLWHKIQNL